MDVHEENQRLRRRIRNLEAELEEAWKQAQIADEEREVFRRLDSCQNILSEMREMTDDPRIPEILALKWGFMPFAPNMRDHHWTNPELAERFNVSEGRISQMYRKAKDILAQRPDLGRRLARNHPDLAVRIHPTKGIIDARVPENE